MPAKYLADLRSASWTNLHFFRNISDALFLDLSVGDLYTSHVAERMVNVVKLGLNPRLRRFALYPRGITTDLSRSSTFTNHDG